MLLGIKTDTAYDRLSLEQRRDWLRWARDAGFDAAWPVSHSDWDVLTDLAVVGQAVPGIPIGTSIIQAMPHHPLQLASQALSVQAATGNRLTLGLGPGAPPLMEQVFGIPYDRPALRLDEFLQVLVPLMRGEEVSFSGQTLHVNGQVTQPDAQPPSVVISALGRRMLRIAGARADGTLTTMVGPRTLRDHIVPSITAAAQNAGRPTPRVIAEVLIAVTDDEAAGRRYFRETDMLGELPSYRAMLDREGVTDAGELATVGDPDAVLADLRRYADAGATELIFCPFGPDAERPRTIAFLADLARSRTLAS